MANVWKPIVACKAHGISMHDTAQNRAHHSQNWHSQQVPCEYVWVPDAHVRACGWTPAEFTAWPYRDVESPA